jgi:hypothetical protein
MRYLFITVLFLSSVYSNNFEKSVKSVIDKSTNIMWQDDIEATQYLEDIEFAKLYCEELILNGYTDWKMPNIKQLQSIVDVNKKSPTVTKEFQYTSKNKYWSNTQFFMDESNYWYVDFQTGITSNDKESNTYNVRCIREMK